jgi:hypothetical protein
MSTDPIPPPYFITADDQRGLIVVTVAIVLAFVWVCSLIRIWLRFQSRDWKADDWLLSAATVSGTCNGVRKFLAPVLTSPHRRWTLFNLALYCIWYISAWGRRWME